MKGKSDAHLKVSDSKERGEDKISLDDVIANFEAIVGITECAEKILAAAITLCDCIGRDRKQAMRNMAATWNVARYGKLDNS